MIIFPIQKAVHVGILHFQTHPQWMIRTSHPKGVFWDSWSFHVFFPASLIIPRPELSTSTPPSVNSMVWLLDTSQLWAAGAALGWAAWGFRKWGSEHLISGSYWVILNYYWAIFFRGALGNLRYGHLWEAAICQVFLEISTPDRKNILLQKSGQFLHPIFLGIAIYGGFLSHRGNPQSSSMLDWDFLW